MANSMLAAIREAILAPTDDGSVEASYFGCPPNGSTESPASVDEAYASAFKVGRKAVNDRVAAVFNSPGIKGDGARMAAAFDLAMSNPDMATADVASFVAGHLGGTVVNAEAYEAMRLSAGGINVAGLARPSAARGEASSWKSFTEARNAKFEVENPSLTRAPAEDGSADGSTVRAALKR
ncbi:hypothetical protein [Mesorhizobium sp. L-2-11]|uniref:hypothetical protein n=1 Tax=Mesorhizobium sp. L-2-11 TaxID=2744521 RepID=UPI0019288CBD|nr:hypothetical protein [Mesorhizobium sp. L-2-11]BCH18862.1 hypothetical protein MesoLjLa_57130 [Mesorhizobium sp. L-2-11]